MVSLSETIVDRTIYRGVKQDFSSRYTMKDTIVWWSFTSCTTSINVLKSELFLGKTGQRTMFTIETESAVDIRNHSYYPAEDEVLLLPARQFEVRGCLDQAGGLYLIQVKETQPSAPLLKPIIVGKFSVCDDQFEMICFRLSLSRWQSIQRKSQRREETWIQYLRLCERREIPQRVV